VIATMMPVTVRAVLSLWRQAFRTMRRGTNMFDRRGVQVGTMRSASIFSLNYERRPNFRASPAARKTKMRMADPATDTLRCRAR